VDGTSPADPETPQGAERRTAVQKDERVQPPTRDTDKARAILDEALATAHSIGEEHDQAGALCEVASAVAQLDPQQALQIAECIADRQWQAEAFEAALDALIETDPQRALVTAQQIFSGTERAALELSYVAAGLATTDPDRATAIARENEDPATRGWALFLVGSRLKDSDPGRSQQLIREAIEATRSITDAGQRDTRIQDIAHSLARVDPELGVETARLIGDTEEHAQTLRLIARQLAETAPDKAIEIAYGIESAFRRAQTVAEIAAAAAATDPPRSQRLAREALKMAQDLQDPLLVCQAARALSRTHPGEAIALVQNLPHDEVAGGVVEDILFELAREDRTQALDIAHNARDPRSRALALYAVASGVAQMDARDALRIARDIHDAQARAWAMGAVALSFAPKALDTALAVARSIEDDVERVESLCRIARTLLAR